MKDCVCFYFVPLLSFLFSATKLLHKVCLKTNTDVGREKHCYYTINCIILREHHGFVNVGLKYEVTFYFCLKSRASLIVYEFLLTEIQPKLYNKGSKLQKTTLGAPRVVHM